MSQIIIAGVFKQKLCMGKTWSCGTFRAVTAAKSRTRSFAWSLLQTPFKKSLWLFLPGTIRGLSVLVTRKPLKNDTTKFAKYFSWWAECKEDKSPVSTQATCRAVWDWQERAVSFSWAGCFRKAPSPCLPRLPALSRLFLPSTRKSNTFLQPRDVLSAGDKVLFRLSLLCNMQCCPWNCHFTLISYTSAWIYH